MAIFTAQVILKKRSSKIISSVLLLLTFVIGQVIIFAHTHKTETSHSHFAVKQQAAGSVDTKCHVCAQSSHVQLYLQTQQIFFSSTSSLPFHAAYTAVYQSIKLLLYDNRGPPLAAICA